MNSYFKQNRNYRETYKTELAEISEGKRKKSEFTSKYPNNINYSDFFMYMIHPTLVY